mgnify:CR=1 FL=1
MKYLKKLLWKPVLLFVLLGPTSGCTLSTPQLDAAVDFITTLTYLDSDDVSVEPAIWLASVGEQGAVLSPYATSGLIVFANADGNAIAFDGWTVRAITGFGLSDPVSISGKQGSRSFSFGSIQFFTDCGSWALHGNTWSQSCGNGDGVIELNDAGEIQRITMPLGKRWGNVTLRVAK